MIDRQWLALVMNDYGVVHINYVVSWTANRSGMVTLTFDLLTLKLMSESRVTWATSVPILVFLGLFVLELGPMYATDVRQTDVRQKHRLMPPPIRGEGIIIISTLDFHSLPLSVSSYLQSSTSMCSWSRRTLICYAKLTTATTTETKILPRRRL